MLALYASAYISECSRKSNIIKEYIYDGGGGGVNVIACCWVKLY